MAQREEPKDEKNSLGKSVFHGINLNKIKVNSVDNGILKVLILLRETKDGIVELLKDEDVVCVVNAKRELGKMMDDLCEDVAKLCGIMEVVFIERSDVEIEKELKKNNVSEG